MALAGGVAVLGVEGARGVLGLCVCVLGVCEVWDGAAIGASWVSAVVLLPGCILCIVCCSSTAIPLSDVCVLPYKNSAVPPTAPTNITITANVGSFLACRIRVSTLCFVDTGNSMGPVGCWLEPTSFCILTFTSVTLVHTGAQSPHLDN